MYYANSVKMVKIEEKIILFIKKYAIYILKQKYVILYMVKEIIISVQYF
jgi:hypothetical protein